MIIVTIELVPYGLGEPERIGYAEISNDGTGSKSVGNYRFKLFRKKLIKSGEVKGFKRQRKHVWHLLKEILQCLD